MDQKILFDKKIIDELYEPVYFVDKNRVITFWNKAAEELTGFTKKEVIGRSCSDNILIHVDKTGNNLCTGICPLAHTMKDKKRREANVFLHHKKGHRIPIQVKTSPIIDSKGNVIGAIEIFSDTTSTVELENRIDELKRLSMNCPLTNIANRRYANIYIKERIDDYKRYNWASGIIFFDVDNFKNFNDKYSHETGDKVLKMVANTLKYNVRIFDLVARWGGEEFIVVLKNITKDILKDKAELFRMLIEKSVLFEENGDILRVTVSGGACLTEIGDTAEKFINRADQLMYKSKQSGKNKITFID